MRTRVIAEGPDAPTNTRVRVVVVGGEGDLPYLEVEKLAGTDATGGQRWERVSEAHAARVALGVLAAKLTFMDVLGAHVPVPGEPTDGDIDTAAKAIVERLFMGPLTVNAEGRKTIGDALYRIAFEEIAKLVRRG